MPRRVEPGLATVWVALRRPARVRLQLYRGLAPAASPGAALPAKPIEHPAQLPAGVPPDEHTLAVGVDLHIALATFEPAEGTSLEPGQIYSYDLRITARGELGEDLPEVGLAQLGLLEDREIEGPYADPVTGIPPRHRHLALGYNAGFLPSFVLPPADPIHLRIAQGSCRYPDGVGRDALAILDDLIDEHLADPLRRVHMFVMTGDQIYADSPSPANVQILNPIGSRLLSGNDRDVVETLTIDLPGMPGSPFPIDLEHFPAGRRTHLANGLGGFSAADTHSHVLGVGEFAAMYLMNWSIVLWPDTDGLTMRLRDRWTKEVEPYRTAFLDLRKAIRSLTHDKEAAEERLEYYEAWRLVPAELRRIDQYLTVDDHKLAWGEVDQAAGYAATPWARAWAGTKRADPPVPDEITPPTAPLPDPGWAPRNLLARILTPAWYAGKEHFRVEVGDDDTGTIRRDSVRGTLHRMLRFCEELPAVRRALANVATYAVFDDHDVTDDWNITAGWVRRVRGNAFGRSVVRNALVAYALFQGWGNDPRAFAAQDPAPDGESRAAPQVLRHIARLFFDEAGDFRPTGPDPDATAKLEHHFDLKSLFEPPPPLAERMFWHYRYDGPGFEMLGLDTRTWRGYEPEGDVEIDQPFSDLSTAPLLSDEALRLQIPVDPAPGVNPDGYCLVIAAAPVLGFPPVESVVQPFLNLNDIVKPPPDPPFVALKRAYHIGRINHDPEPWGYVPRTFEAVLERLSNRRRVLFLSGDVHYSCTMRMAYWHAEPDGLRTTRFVQLTSSSLRKQRTSQQVELFTMDLVQILADLLSANLERMGWRGGPPEAEVPIRKTGTDLNPRIDALLQQLPILIPPRAVPADAELVRPPDWAWRMSLVGDPRPDTERLAVLTPPPIVGAEDGPATMLRAVGARHFWQAQHAPPRRWQWWTNLTVVDFAADPEPRVRHTVYSHDLAGVEVGAQAYLIVEIPLEVGDEPPPTIPFVPLPDEDEG